MNRRSASMAYRKSPPRLHPPQRFRYDAVPRQFARIVSGKPKRTERQLRNVRDLLDVELTHLIARLVVVGVLSIEELHDGDTALEIRTGIGARIVVLGAH